MRYSSLSFILFKLYQSLDNFFFILPSYSANCFKKYGGILAFFFLTLKNSKHLFKDQKYFLIKYIINIMHARFCPFTEYANNPSPFSIASSINDTILF